MCEQERRRREDAAEAVIPAYFDLVVYPEDAPKKFSRPAVKKTKWKGACSYAAKAEGS